MFVDVVLVFVDVIAVLEETVPIVDVVDMTVMLNGLVTVAGQMLMVCSWMSFSHLLLLRHSVGMNCN